MSTKTIRSCSKALVTSLLLATTTMADEGLNESITTIETLPKDTSKQDDKSPVLVLAIDGASVRGVAQFTLLQGIEKALSEPITDTFDLFVGTSAGSINVGAMMIPENWETANIPGGNNSPSLTLNSIKELLPVVLTEAFSSGILRQVRTVGGLMGSKYSAKPFEEYLADITKGARMSDTVKPALLTSYDFRAKEVMNFSTSAACDPKVNQEKNVFLWQAMRASSAAPVYYKPLEMTLGGKDRALVDAGLFVMSPTIVAWIEARKLFPNRKIVIVSIASGYLGEDRKIASSGKTAGSIPKVLEPTIETALEGQQALTHDLMASFPDTTYHRLSFLVTNKEFDDVSDKNVKALEKAAQDTINDPSSGFAETIVTLKNARDERNAKNDLEAFVCQRKAMGEDTLTRKVGPFKDHGVLAKWDKKIIEGSNEMGDKITKRFEDAGEKIKSRFDRVKESFDKTFSPKK